MSVLEGDVYSPLTNEKFDVIFWNVPFGLVDKDVPVLDKAVFDKGYESCKKFIFGAKKHLNPNGRLLIGFSTTLGKFDLLKKFLDEAGFSLKLVSKIDAMETNPVFFEIFEAKPL